MPELRVDQQPTVAIITTLETGKVAVEAMMDNKVSYEIDKGTFKDDPTVYTMGNIGSKKVVLTKLPSSIRSEDARIFEGGFTTQCLETFRSVKHVFLVGVGGGVLKRDDSCSQILRGDVVISLSREDQGSVYYHYGNTGQGEDGDVGELGPHDTVLRDIARRMEATIDVNSGYAPWIEHMQQGRQKLRGQRGKFTRPIEDDDSILTSHCRNPDEIDRIQSDDPKVHFGQIASCSEIFDNDPLLLDFVGKYGISAFESGFANVVDSIRGNAKDSYMLVLGVADFKNGSLGKEWGLAAAAVVKTIIITLDS